MKDVCGPRARPFLCSNGLLRTCPDRNRADLIGIVCMEVAAMQSPKPARTGGRMRDHRAQHAPTMVSCERPSPNLVTMPPNGEGVPRSLPDGGLHERG